jgi:lipid A 3-O-deacylase
VNRLYLGLVCSLWLLCWLSISLMAAEEPGRRLETPPSLEELPTSIWSEGVGSGLRSGTTLIGGTLGASVGLTAFGSQVEHDLALAGVSYGWVLGDVMATNHWWRGNLEIRLELFGGCEFNPSKEWLVGLTPHVRYQLATGTRVAPFLDLGVGVTATSIGAPDLSGVFQFNNQIGGGLEWYVRDDFSLTLEGRFLHISNGGISHPNLGVNGVMIMLGMTWLY